MSIVRLFVDILVSCSAIGAMVFGWINRAAIKEVHLTMNSRLDELIATTRTMAFAEGKAAQTAEVATAAAAVLESAANKAAAVLETAAKKVE